MWPALLTGDEKIQTGIVISLPGGIRELSWEREGLQSSRARRQLCVHNVWVIPQPAKLLLDLRGTCLASWGVGMATIRPGFLGEALIFNILSCCQPMCHRF